MRTWAKFSRVMTVMTVLGIMGASYVALQWMEDESPRALLSTERLQIDIEAPAQYAKGPWQTGHTFDRSSVGIPLELAPIWQVTAMYSRDGAPVQEGRWGATVETIQRGSGGKAWWTHEQEIEITESDGQANLSLNMTKLVENADRMKSEADVPGALQIRVAVHRTSTVMTESGPAEATRTARLLIDPQESFVRVEAHDDEATYHTTGAQGFPTVAAGLGMFTFAAGGLALYARTRVPSSPLRTALPVRGLKVPGQSVRVDSESLARMARSRASTLLVDRDTGLLYLGGDIPMTGQLSAEEMKVFRDNKQESWRPHGDGAEHGPVERREGTARGDDGGDHDQ